MISCTAPAGYSIVSIQLNVTSYTASYPFSYDPPVVSSVSPSGPIDASSTDVSMTVNGSNFGLAVHPLPVVLLGKLLCQSVNRVSDSSILCRASSSAVGRQAVTVTLGDLQSSGLLYIDRMCGVGLTGTPGEYCKACPTVRVCLNVDAGYLSRSCAHTHTRAHTRIQGALCLESYPQPIPAPGYYQTGFDSFIGCLPKDACPGGIATLSKYSNSLDIFYGSGDTLVRARVLVFRCNCRCNWHLPCSCLSTPLTTSLNG